MSGNEFTQELPPPARVMASDEVGGLLVFTFTVLAQWVNRQCHYNLVFRAGEEIYDVKTIAYYKAIELIEETIGKLLWSNSVDAFLTILEGKEEQWQEDNRVDMLAKEFFAEVALAGKEVLDSLPPEESKYGKL
jgi:hypothetical protein